MAEGTTPEEEAYKRKQEYKAYLHKHGAYEHGAARTRRDGGRAGARAPRQGAPDGGRARETGDGQARRGRRAIRVLTGGPPTLAWAP